MWDAGWEEVVAALRQLEGLTPLPCDGRGHHLEGFASCLHLTIEMGSPARELFLGRLAPLVRRQAFVLASLVERPDHFNLAYRPGKSGGDLQAAASALAARLRVPSTWESVEPTDRRGRS